MKGRWFVVTSALTLGCASQLHAQESTQESSETSGALEEVLVTARQREESLQRVPDTVVAFTARDIEGAGIQSVQDALALVPSISFVDSQDAGLASISIRGVGQVRNGEAPVAIVIDGVQATSPDQIKQALFDVERIEVLKGPQGALYGRNAIGGAIVVTTKAPGSELGGEIRGTVANGNGWGTEGVVSGPVTDTLSFRVVGTYDDFDGVIDNVTLGRKVDFRESESVRGKLLWKPGDVWTVDLSASYSNQDGGGSWYIFSGDGQPNNTSLPVIADELGTSGRKLSDASLRIDHESALGTFRSVTATSQVDVSLHEDLDWTADSLLVADQDRSADSWSQELRFTSSSAQRVRWMAGVYYQETERAIDTILLIPPRPFFPSPVTRTTEDNNASAVFTQINADLTPRLELTLAARYDEDERTLRDRLVPAPDRSETFSLLQPKASLAYKIGDGLVYATVARGFRSGGFNPPASVFQDVFAAEETTSVELGGKSTWADGRVTLNAALFQTVFDNQQQFVLNGAQQGIVNLEKSETRGVEVELQARPVRSVTLAASVSHLDSEIKRFDDTDLFRGNRVPLTYGWSSSLSAQYARPLGWADFTVRAD